MTAGSMWSRWTALGLLLLVQGGVHGSHVSMEQVWTAWSRWSPCSVTCGQGVNERHRECVAFDGHRLRRIESAVQQCEGRGHEHATCEIRACAADAEDMYEYQCSQKNRERVSGKYHQWTPFTGMNMAARCELACVASEYNFYYNFGAALDGTPCGERTDDRQYLCVNGMCKRFGCDGVAGSHTMRDWCKVCGGDNNNCSYITETFDMRNPLTYGYQLVVKIPAGATHIEVIDRSYNYLAVSDANDMYLINGDFRLDWPGEYPYGGTMVTYTRNRTTETLSAEGPTLVDLYVKVIFREYNPGIEYKFFIPTPKLPEIERPANTDTDTKEPMIGPTKPHEKSEGEDKHGHENEIDKGDSSFSQEPVVHIDHSESSKQQPHEEGNQLNNQNEAEVEHNHENNNEHARYENEAQHRDNTRENNHLTNHGSNNHNSEFGNNGADSESDVFDETVPQNVRPPPGDDYYNFQDALYDSGGYLDDLLRQRQQHYEGQSDVVNTDLAADPDRNENNQASVLDQQDFTDPNDADNEANVALDGGVFFEDDPIYRYDDAYYIYDDGVPATPNNQAFIEQPDTDNNRQPAYDGGAFFEDDPLYYGYEDEDGTNPDPNAFLYAGFRYDYGYREVDPYSIQYPSEETLAESDELFQEGHEDDLYNPGERLPSQPESESKESYENIFDEGQAALYPGQAFWQSLGNNGRDHESRETFHEDRDNIRGYHEETNGRDAVREYNDRYYEGYETHGSERDYYPANLDTADERGDYVLASEGLGTHIEYNTHGGDNIRYEHQESHSSHRAETKDHAPYNADRADPYDTHNPRQVYPDSYPDNRNHHSENIHSNRQPEQDIRNHINANANDVDTFVDEDADIWEQLFGGIGFGSEEENIDFNAAGDTPANDERFIYDGSYKASAYDTNGYADNIQNGRNEQNHHSTNTYNGELSHHRPDNAQHQPDNSQHRPDNSQHRPDNSQHRPDNSQHRADNSQHRPDNSQHRPDSSQHRPDTSQPANQHNSLSDSQNLFHVSNAENYNYNQPDENYPGDPYSESFRHEPETTHQEIPPYRPQEVPISLEDRAEDGPVSVEEELVSNYIHAEEETATEEPAYEYRDEDYLSAEEDVYKGGPPRLDWGAYYNYIKKYANAAPKHLYGADCPVCPALIARKEYVCQSDFRIRGVVKAVREVRGDTRYEVHVVDQYDARVPLMAREYIWARGACPCPLLQPDHEYIILGRLIADFDTRESRLLIEDDGYVTRYSARHSARLRAILQTQDC